VTTPTREALVRRSAAALFLCAGLITIANQLLAAPAGTHTPVVIGFGLLSLLSGAVVLLTLRRTAAWWVKPAIAVWGLVLLVATAGFGNTVASPKEPMAVVIFMMVILVWLGLTAGRGVASAFAPLALLTAAILAGLPDSRVVFADSALVIAVSTAVAETIAWAMHELSRRETQLATQAMTDPLTGLSNRAELTDRLDEACDADERVVLAFVDLNGFKDINDTFGHQAGDTVLVEVGARLTRVARDRDVVARFGGDEFVVLFREVPPDVRPNALVERIRAALDEPWTGLGSTTVTASVGVVDNRDGDAGPEELIRIADTAMYSRKHGTESAGSPKLMISRALAHHRAAMDGLGGGFCVLRRIGSRDDWIVVEANRRIRDAFVPVFGDPVGRLLSELNRHADNSSALDLYARVLATGDRAEREIEIQIPGEPAAWRRLVAVPIAPDTVAALTWDITAERSALRALADAMEYSTAVVETAADAILTVGADGRIAGCNRAAELTFGTDRDDAIGRRYGDFVPVASDPVLRAAFASGGDTRVETSLLRSDGSEFVAQVAISEVETSQGTMFTAIVRDVTEQRAAESALRVALECDDLTGRPNLHSLMLRTDEAARRAEAAGHSIGVLFVDVDRFTLVNDSLGHDLGDSLLVEVADRVAGVVRENDVVARISGDHFLVLCDRVDDDDVLVELASRIHDVLRTPFVLGRGHEVFVTVSIGAARWHGREAPRDLVRFAHTAMQQAKRNGPSTVRVFSGEMAVVSASRLETETALRRALARNELQAYYQPIVDLGSGATVRMEALVRWGRPGTGLVQPDEFIDLAEQTGLIIPLGAWILRRALTDCAGWQSDAPGVGVAVNVSAHQFRTGDLVVMVQALLTELDLVPDLVTLEITESLMLEHSAWNLAVLEELRAIGVRLALDDFGTGYSALTHLRRLPIDAIKMDRSFLDGVDAADGEATVRAIVELARVHGMEVVAEGIETTATRDLVQAAGCHRGQGYLFGRPERLDAALLSLRASTPALPRATSSRR
jgi:diguanylate cyclase (GGDEF)-like protein/PAS domain S-box-containing protein